MGVAIFMVSGFLFALELIRMSEDGRPCFSFDSMCQRHLRSRGGGYQASAAQSRRYTAGANALFLAAGRRRILGGGASHD